jgi:hypothetical protein
VVRERPDLTALALERLGESLQAVWRRLSQLKPWAVQHRLGLSLAAVLLAIGLVLPNLLVQLRPAPSAGPLAKSASFVTNAGSTVASSSTTSSTAEAGSGTVVFRIEPWGEILIDNKPTGVSPPLVQIALSTGRHQIEVRHGDDAPFTREINVEAALPVKVEHHFE